MRIGLIDVDGHNYPNLPLMKLSAYHKGRGDEVGWYDVFIGHCDVVYMSKVFSFTPDYPYEIDADKVVKGGSGYAIRVIDGTEVYDKSIDPPLPREIEHTYPDYSLYPELTRDTAYGFLTRGCPRGCAFCHVGGKEGTKSIKVADLSEFWTNQKNIVLSDPNILACRDWEELLRQLADSRAVVDFNQGLDIRLMTDDKAYALSEIRTKMVRFAWDRPDDKAMVIRNLTRFNEITKIDCRKTCVYVLCGFATSFSEDLERIYTLRELGYSPYVMLYRKVSIPQGDKLRHLQRWCNNRTIFRSCDRFEDYAPVRLSRTGRQIQY